MKGLIAITRAQAEEVLTETALIGQATTAKAKKSLTEETSTKDLQKGEKAVSAALSEIGIIEEITTASLSTATDAKAETVAHSTQIGRAHV